MFRLNHNWLEAGSPKSTLAVTLLRSRGGFNRIDTDSLTRRLVREHDIQNEQVDLIRAHKAIHFSPSWAAVTRKPL